MSVPRQRFPATTRAPFRRLAVVAAIAAISFHLGAEASRKPAAAAAAPPTPIENSVVRIVSFQQHPSWYAPWDAGSVQQASGSSFVVDGGMVMTNAHVVSDAKLLILFVYGDPDPHPAEVVYVGHDCDLALVRPKDPKVLASVPTLRFGGLPRLGTAVDTYGYPAGGTEVSSTRGVVSRIESQGYAHSGADRHLIGQTDAAINPGNSGGPVVQDGKVVGVAFQAAEGLENVGYFIPTEVVSRFLEDVSDGRYDGYVELGLSTVNLDNPAARRAAGMTDTQTGVQVDGVLPGSSADGVVLAGDVLLSVDGKAVANDGSVLDLGLRMPFGMLIDRKLVGEEVALDILRDGKPRKLPVTMATYPASVWHSNAYDRSPRYFIFGGLVFVPLELETIKTYGDEWPATADKALLYEFLYRPIADKDLLRQERVVLLRRLDHRVNAGVAWFKNLVVERVNGRTIHKLEDLIAAIDANTSDYDVFEFSDYRRIAVLDHRAAKAAGAEILARYGIAADRHL